MNTIRFGDGSIQEIYNYSTAGATTVLTSGKGTIFTYRVYGTAGQTGEVRGGFSGDLWEDMQQICVLTVADPNPVSNPQTAHSRAAFPVLMVQGNIKIGRGA